MDSQKRVFDGLGMERYYESTFLGVLVIDMPDGIRVVQDTMEGVDFLTIQQAKELKNALGNAIVRAEERQAQEEARRARGMNQERLL